ncbi:hypothetical protein ACSNN7_29120, partial [Micromonospora sp. URMC 105]|uniref:hypothetical protein n=1 Tax=Micromonospora sp. URMC 105 TaxID=3423413 RepID=UPI003F19BAB4
MLDGLGPAAASRLASAQPPVAVCETGRPRPTPPWEPGPEDRWLTELAGKVGAYPGDGRLGDQPADLGERRGVLT